MDGLDRVDDHEFGFRLVDRGDDVRQRRLGMEPQTVADGTQPLRPTLDLVGALLRRDVQRRSVPRGEQLEQQRALADARLTTQQRDRAGDQAATEHPVEFDDRGGDRVALLRSHVPDGCGAGPMGREQRDDAKGWSVHLLGQRVPGTTAGALARPLGMRGAAPAADVHHLDAPAGLAGRAAVHACVHAVRRRCRHGVILTRGSDIGWPPGSPPPCAMSERTGGGPFAHRNGGRAPASAHRS